MSIAQRHFRVPVSVSLGSFSAINDFSKTCKNLQELKALVIDRNFVNVRINYTCGFKIQFKPENLTLGV